VYREGVYCLVFGWDAVLFCFGRLTHCFFGALARLLFGLEPALAVHESDTPCMGRSYSFDIESFPFCAFAVCVVASRLAVEVTSVHSRNWGYL
jgi:hypothetical protein